MDALLNNYLGTTQLSASLIIPVVAVLVGAILVFVCGIRKPKEPQFRKIAASVESSSKKTKRKDKAPSSTSAKASVQNGSAKQTQQVAATTGSKKQSIPAAKKEKESQQSLASATKRKEAAAPKKAAAKTNANEKSTSKKSSGKADKGQKPADFDDGGWTTVPSRTDKKKKQDDQVATQGLDGALPQPGKKSTGGNKADAKSTKNAKQLKDQANKSKKEAAESNKKNKSNAADNEQVNNKVADKIENLVNELKDSGSFGKQSKIADSIDHGSEEKSDDSKPVSGVVFNEMADTWTEAKAPKKGKKKARKD